MDDDETPLTMRLKDVTVMDCSPGDASNGEPITIITLAHNDEFEEPLLINLNDTKRLVVDLFISLASHGDEFAEYMLENYFAD